MPARSIPPKPPTSWSKPCAPRCWPWARCWRAGARPRCRCPAAARSAPAPGAPKLKGRPPRGGATWAGMGEMMAGLAAGRGRLKGAHIATDMITVTGTETFLMAATLAEGETVLENAAQEPEIVDLAEMLIAMGAQIEGHG